VKAHDPVEIDGKRYMIARGCRKCFGRGFVGVSMEMRNDEWRKVYTICRCAWIQQKEKP